MKYIYSIFWQLTLWSFIAVKLGGASLAGWSWWWLLAPAVPLLGILVGRLGL